MRLQQLGQSVNLLSAMAAEILVIGCIGDITSPNDPGGVENYEHLSVMLEEAYQKQSQTDLDRFFTVWEDLTPAATSSEIAVLPDTLRQVYKIFTEFYSPTNLNRVTNGGHENFETYFRYIVIQNSVRISVVDTNPKLYYYQGVTSREYEISDFRPAINSHDFRTVYLTPQANSVIFHFLYGADTIIEGQEPHNSRVSFLRHAMQLTHHHWIRDYHKVTMPVALRIIMNESKNKAIVDFRVFYQFGDAYLERQNNEWILVDSKLTAIE